MGTYCVTGSGSGIGAATKARLEADGHRVIGVDLQNADVIADMSSPAGRQAAVEAVLAACGGTLDGLVPCAGVSNMDDALMVKVNYFGVMAMLDGLKPALEQGTDPAVVLISSNSTSTNPGFTRADAAAFLQGEEAALAHFAGKGYLAYPAGKLGIAYWVRANAVSPEWGGKGIRINAVAPGVIATAMTKPLMEDPTMLGILESMPIVAGRWGQPEEIAEVIAFLLSKRSSFIYGQTIFADGGQDAATQPTGYPNPMDEMS